MTKTIFGNWLERFNIRMAHANRKIALIVDNATCHSINKTLSNIDIIFLSKNTTSLIQPCDQEIIKSFKDKFLKFMMTSIINYTNNADDVKKIFKKTTIFDAICIAKLSWDDVSS